MIKKNLNQLDNVKDHENYPLQIHESLLSKKVLVIIKNLYGSFLRWGSTASKLQSHFEEAVYFSPLH